MQTMMSRAAQATAEVDMRGSGVQRRRVKDEMSWLDIAGEWIVWAVILSKKAVEGIDAGKREVMG